MSALYDITADFLIKSGYRPIHAGDDYDHTFRVERPPGTALNLTGARLWFTVKAEDTDTDAEAKLQLLSVLLPGQTTPGLEITDAAAGVFILHLSAANTDELAGSWSYDIQARLSSTKIITIARGIIEFLPHMTVTRT